MTAEESARLLALLDDIRAAQKLQLEHENESLELQRMQFAIFQEQVARSERMREKSALLQDRSAALGRGARKTFLAVVPILVVVVAYLSSLLLRWRF